jgi:ectoine hydroxylase-related dioxygenase (phytanoyl-CoA dioxygenase family)
MNNRLSRVEIDQFHLQGYLGPYTAMSPAEIKPVDEYLHNQIFLTTGPNPKDNTHSRHLDIPELYEIVSHPAIVERLACLLGEDLIIWTGGFFIKEPHGVGRATPMHQDINYWPLEPQINITAWIALEDVTAENAPLRIIPGSHQKMLHHTPAPDSIFDEEADPSQVDMSRAITLPMRAGQFIIFSERLVHGADANFSNTRRCGMAARYTVPFTRVFPDRNPINFPAHHTIVVSGTDKFGFNRVGAPPVRKAPSLAQP